MSDHEINSDNHNVEGAATLDITVLTRRPQSDFCEREAKREAVQTGSCSRAPADNEISLVGGRREGLPALPRSMARMLMVPSCLVDLAVKQKMVVVLDPLESQLEVVRVNHECITQVILKTQPTVGSRRE